MIVGATLGVEPYHNKDPIFSLSPRGSCTHILALIIGAIVQIISLGFGTITWFPSSATHDS